MQIVIYGKVLHEADLEYVQVLFDALHDEGVNLYVYKPYWAQLSDKIKLKRDVATIDGYYDFKTHNFDFVVTLGGDGTILDAITVIRDAEIPILGINLGRLGFLAHIAKTHIREAIKALMARQYQIEWRRLLALESNMSLFDGLTFALNDFTILKRDTSSMITIHTFLNGAYLNSYWADGLIVATPTGSTGYSLSCGGPIVFPQSGNFVITPVAPHNLNVRPIIISDKSVLSFEVEGRAENFLCTLDSRFETIDSSYQLAVRSCDFVANIVVLQGESYLKTIRQKLAWGVDARNH
jgi:NAD+ kinase